MKARISIVAALAAFSGSAEASISFGPWTFDDLAFGDQATQLDTGPVTPYCGATTVDDALSGFSPTTMLANIGYTGGGNHFEIAFTDLLAVNLSGPDLVFFEARYSSDDFEIAVRPAGSATFTAYLPYLAAQFVNTTFPNTCSGTVFGVPIELDAYGLTPGTVVDAIRFRGLSAEGDPVMAGVLNGTGPCFAPLGVGCPGTGGIQPALVSATCAAAGQPFSLSLHGGLGGSTALLVFGAGPSTTVLPGGCVLDVGPLFPLTLTVPLGGAGAGQGTFTLGTVLPATLTPGSVGIQAFVLDPLPPIGASATPGYVLTIG